jgi:hypothetical protein
MSSGPKTRVALGPTSPRGQKQAAAMQAVKDQNMAKKMRDAYENFQKSPEADTIGLKKGGKVKSRSSASKRADGIAIKGKTRGKMV